MKLDKTFESEIRKTANGDGGRDYKFALIEELKEVSAMLANRYNFDDCVKKFGRAKVALCVAATIVSFRYRYENNQIAWAEAIIALWTNKCEQSVSIAVINTHSAILADNSRSLRKLTVEEVVA
jgi:hypothetical protein